MQLKKYNIQISENLFLILFILLVATVLRLIYPFDIPFMNDEFSALFRTKFSTFSELIEKGVKVDGHPAGIQVFLFYWTKFFDYSEFVVKIPFIIFGILSVLLIFKIGERWYNSTVGLICSSFLATLEYSINYSQIARPYISGLLFILLMVYYWDKIIIQPEKYFKRNSVFFILSWSLCSYNHHFSLLLSVIVGITGIFFIQKKYLLKYLISCLMVFILYIPHLSIFFYQLKIGGVEGWLGKPDNKFIINYFKYIFHFSPFIFALVFGLILFGIFSKNKKNKFNKYTLISFLWFSLPFLIGFFYSIYIKAVLQYSVLIFSFPFFLFLIFGHIPDVKKNMKIAIILVICTVSTISLIFERQYYTLFYQPAQKQMLILTDSYIKKLGKKNCISIIHLNKNISNYYTTKLNLNSGFNLFDNFLSKKDFINFLKNNNKPYLTFGCLSGIDPDIVPVILDFYPFICEKYDFYNGSFYVFSINKMDKNILYYSKFESNFNSKTSSTEWITTNNSSWKNNILFKNKSSYYIDSTQEYSPTFSDSLYKMVINKNCFVDISLEILPESKLTGVIIVSVMEVNDKIVDWRGTNVNDFVCDTISKIWIKAHHTIKLSDLNVDYKGVVLKVFIWNSAKKKFYFNDFKIRTRIGNQVIYGLSEKLL